MRERKREREREGQSQWETALASRNSVRWCNHGRPLLKDLDLVSNLHIPF